MEINVIRGPCKGARLNILNLLNACGECDLYHILFDDDIIYPRFYEYHAGMHQSPEVICSISRRWNAIASGFPVGNLKVPSYIEQNMARALILEPEPLFKTTVPTCYNWLGEFSNAVLKNEAARLFKDQQLAGVCYEGLGDIGLFLHASLIGKVAFIQDYLGFFRQNPGQNTGNLQSNGIKAGYLAQFALAVGARRLNLISTEETWNAFRIVDKWVLGSYPQDEEMQAFVTLVARHQNASDRLLDEFTALWEKFLAAREFF